MSDYLELSQLNLQMELENTENCAKGILFSRSLIQTIADTLAISWQPTHEVQLKSLGVFPLPGDHGNLLEQTITPIIANEPFTVPGICKTSQIPIFCSNSHILIPVEAFPACRYFADSWHETTTEMTELQKLLVGFLTLNSFIS